VLQARQSPGSEGSRYLDTEAAQIAHQLSVLSLVHLCAACRQKRDDLSIDGAFIEPFDSSGSPSSMRRFASDRQTKVACDEKRGNAVAFRRLTR
jgi:hypothetical protein